MECQVICTVWYNISGEAAGKFEIDRSFMYLQQKTTKVAMTPKITVFIPAARSRNLLVLPEEN